MSYVMRTEFEALERRVQKAEQLIRAQETQIKLLQGRTQPAGGAFVPTFSDPIASFRDRSRSPMPIASMKTMAPKKQQLPSPGGAVMSLADFAAQNGLDEKSIEALGNQPEEVQQYVIGLGPAEGRNPSAMIMGRIAKATTEFVLPPLSMRASAFGGYGGAQAQFGSDWEGAASFEGVEEFIAAHTLDEKCAEALRSQPVECQMAVVGAGPADGRNPSAMIMGRIAKYTRGEL